jgi:hypothetical protein
MNSNSIFSKPSFKNITEDIEEMDGPEDLGIKTSDDGNKGQLI